MAHHSSNPYGADMRVTEAIDRQRERERQHMLQQASREADTLAVRLVQRLLDAKVLETTADKTIAELFATQLRKLPTLDEFAIQYKTAPIRTLVDDPNLVSLYITQYIVEDLIDHPKVTDIYGDDLDIYRAVDSVLRVVRPGQG